MVELHKQQKCNYKQALFNVKEHLVPGKAKLSGVVVSELETQRHLSFLYALKYAVIVV